MTKLLVFCLLILAVFLAAPTVEGDVSFNLSGVTKTSYATFLNAYRADLPYKETVFDIILLPVNVTGSSRYTRIHLTNSYNQTIQLAIDVTNVYVLGFYTTECNLSHFFNDSVATEAKKFVFTDSKQQTLSFDGSYGQLAGAGGRRQSLKLGLVDLNYVYIPTLYGYNCPGYSYKPSDVAKAMVVVIQTISEAARFQKIQKDVKYNSIPTAEVLSLENNWSKLSKLVKQADPTTGNFKVNFTLENATGTPVVVSNVNSPYVKGNIQLLLNKQNISATSENYATI
ncbi:ribosome-inactivating protein bryodin I-like [Momordica charantia]|uniref:rRNA N-glycosylase n=1 Tax=Momordica charantia TaxID=3673 RepID=A0A6J1DV53_MOMCH|nr:ribosome-inactivating protein bryodin I-like [Momordica charantia]